MHAFKTSLDKDALLDFELLLTLQEQINLPVTPSRKDDFTILLSKFPVSQLVSKVWDDDMNAETVCSTALSILCDRLWTRLQDFQSSACTTSILDHSVLDECGVCSFPCVLTHVDEAGSLKLKISSDSKKLLLKFRFEKEGLYTMGSGVMCDMSVPKDLWMSRLHGVMQWSAGSKSTSTSLMLNLFKSSCTSMPAPHLEVSATDFGLRGGDSAWATS